MKVDGACHCGAITYTADVEPAKTQICHCNDCQITAGSAFSFSVPAVTGTLTFTKGAPSIYVKKTAESGRERAHAFCPICATRIYSGSVGVEPQQFTLRAGPLKQRRDLPPQRQVWCGAALAWANIEDGARIEKQ
jgi:hypothetical protein